MRKYNPAHALDLLRSREVVEFACDVVKNPAFSRASATTRDAHGLRIADYVATRASRARWSEQVVELLTLPLPEFERAMTREPVRLSKVPKGDGRTRDIAVPSFVRRCVSNALNQVLAATGDHLLPRCVRAYRRGSESAVQDAILDVAEAVHNGRVRYFAKLDIQSYFSEMAWPSIEAALMHYGYDDAFVQRVLVVVKCPVVRRDHGQLVRVAMDRGAQMGLAESSTLANMLPWALDLELERCGARISYLRYSDDLFIGSSDRGKVVAAVRAVAAWCHQHGLRLKDVERNARLAGVVMDIKKTKVELLGTEIDALGYVHMPSAKLRKKAAEFDHMQARLAAGDVHGVSRFGDGGGVEAFDELDLQRSMTAFLDYWSALDPRGAERARQIFKRRFPLTAATSDAARGAVWLARLWGTRTNREGGTTPTVLDPMMSSEESIPQPIRRSPSATGEPARADLARDSSSQEALRHSDYCPSGPGPASNALAIAPAIQGVEGAAHVYVSTCAGMPSSLEDGTSGRLDEEAPPFVADGHETYRFVTRSLAVEDLWLDDLEQDPTAPRLHQNEGVLGDPTDGASPPWSVFENATYVHAVRARIGRDQVVLLGTCRLTPDGPADRAVVHVAHVRRPESALVREMLVQLTRSGDRIVLCMEQTWLPKGLLQAHRRFRAPLLFALLLELHEAARGRDVLVVGGVELPTLLHRAMRRTLDDLARAAA